MSRVLGSRVPPILVLVRPVAGLGRRCAAKVARAVGELFERHLPHGNAAGELSLCANFVPHRQYAIW